MRTVTEATLAYDLSIALQFGDLPPAIDAHLRGDLERWEAQRVDPQAGITALKGWLQDRGYFVQMLTRMDRVTWRQMARDYVAFLRLYGATDLNPEKLISTWEREIQRFYSAPSTRGGDGDAKAIEHGPSTRSAQEDCTTYDRSLSNSKGG